MAEFGRLSGVQFLLIAEFKYFAALRALDSASCSALSPQRPGIYLSVETNL